MKSSAHCLTTPNATPYLISVQDALLLDKSEGFKYLRKHLAGSLPYDFCQHHDQQSQEHNQSWIVVRDILHALLAPVVALQQHATTIAEEFLQTGRPSDHEYSYAGHARNAFVWLQSFLSTELAWCLTQGCPTCVVQRALDSEEAIRLVIASCLLSGIQSTTDLGRPTLPSFEFFIQSLRDAMDEDDLWGPTMFDNIEPKAYTLQTSMQDLMYQCQTIELNMTPPSSPDSVTSRDTCDFFKPRRLLSVKRSEFAKKQAQMLKEEAQWLRSVVKNCWDTIDPKGYAEPVTTEFLRRLSTVSVES